MALYTDESAALNPYSAAAHIDRALWDEMSMEAQLALMKAYQELAEAARVAQEQTDASLDINYNRLFESFSGFYADARGENEMERIAIALDDAIEHNADLFVTGFSYDFKDAYESIVKSGVGEELNAAKSLFNGERQGGSESIDNQHEREEDKATAQSGYTGWQL